MCLLVVQWPIKGSEHAFPSVPPTLHGLLPPGLTFLFSPHANAPGFKDGGFREENIRTN